MSRSKKRSHRNHAAAAVTTGTVDTKEPVTATPFSDTIPTRQLSNLYTTRATWNCAQQGYEGFCCIPCAYKVGCFDVALDEELTKAVPNQRPEACPRVAAARQERQANDGVSKASLNQHIHVSNLDKQSTSSQISPAGALGYGPGMNVLAVGDGDFSFSLAVARMIATLSPSTSCPIPLVSHLIVTSYETRETLEQVYQKAFHTTLQELQQLHEDTNNGLEITILYQVDATKLNLNTHIASKGRFDRIVWNFPCSSISQGQDGQNAEMEENKELVASFVQQAQCLLDPVTGQIHMNHKTKPPFDQWNMPQVALSKVKTAQGATDNNRTIPSSLKYWGRVVWDRALFSPYVPRKALHAKSFPCHDACTYIFVANNTAAPQQSSTEKDAPWFMRPKETQQILNQKGSDTTPRDCGNELLSTTPGHELLPVTLNMIVELRARLLQQVTSRALWNARRRPKKKAKR